MNKIPDSANPKETLAGKKSQIKHFHRGHLPYFSYDFNKTVEINSINAG